jgi:hypothetical protein
LRRVICIQPADLTAGGGGVAEASFLDDITRGAEALSERREFRVGQSQGTPDQRSYSLPCRLQTFCNAVVSLPVTRLKALRVPMWNSSLSRLITLFSATRLGVHGKFPYEIYLLFM